MLIGSSTDESANAAGSSPRADSKARGKDGSPKRAYDPRAARGNQPSLTQLIPHRWLSHFVVTALQASAILGIITAAASVLDGPLARELWPSFDPQQAGSLADWLASMQCLAVAAACGLVYLVRRHRVDDYRGRYRWWAWAAGLAVVASIDAASHISAQAMSLAISQPGDLPADPAAVAAIWPAVAVVILALGLIWDLRESRAATASLVLVAGGATAHSLLLFRMIAISDPILHDVATTTARLFVPWWLVTTVLLYARYVDLQANGAMESRSGQSTRRRRETSDGDAEPAERRRWWRRKKTDDESTVAAESNPADQAKAKSASRSKSKAANLAEPSSRQRKRGKQRRANSDAAPDNNRQAKSNKLAATPEEAGSDAADEYAGLSKSERRRLRKLKRRQQRQQAA